MRDFPVFDTEYGIASLYLKEIPYKGEAYIRIREVWGDGLEALLKECVSFCRMAGAEKMYAADHNGLEQYPLFSSILQMRGNAQVDPEKIGNLFPVTEATVTQWRQIHNERLRDIDCSATLTAQDEKEILSSGGAYFVHDNGHLLGIGWVQDCELKSIAATEPGSGEKVMHTLMSLIEGQQMILEVASTNTRAIHLYQKQGFLVTGEKTRWHCV